MGELIDEPWLQHPHNRPELALPYPAASRGERGLAHGL